MKQINLDIILVTWPLREELFPVTLKHSSLRYVPSMYILKMSRAAKTAFRIMLLVMIFS